MGWDELQVRARQQAAKGWDAVAHIGKSFLAEKYDTSVRGLGRFFFGTQDLPVLLDLLRERCPGAVEKIVAQAERICRHRFDLLGYQDVDYGEQINWHLDAVHGKQSPRHVWFCISYLDFAQVGDVKIIWELNRHQHLVTLAKAYLLTRENRYLGELLQQWYHWQEHNPYGIGVNWSSSLEVAFRSLSWIWMTQLLSCYETTMPQAFFIDVNKALLMNARHIERFLSTYFSPNTHLLGEGVGLFFIGTLVPGSQRAHYWQEQGWRIILREAERQVLPDGMHFEQSIYYHIYALDFFLHTRILADLNRLNVPPSFDQTITRMLTALAAMANPGPLPNLGDDDGGRVFDPCRNRREHMTDPLSTGAVLFNNVNWKSAVGCISEETIWLLGVEAVKRFVGLQTERQQVNSFALASSGIYVMRGSKPDSQQLVIDAGPQGVERSGHAHADALSVQVALNDHMILIDPGTGAYVSANEDREKFRGTAAHNTVQVDGMNQADSAGPFGWRDLPTVSVDSWVTGESFDLFAGSHNGYSRLPDPVVHRRYIFYLKGKFWLIRDIVTGEHRHTIQGSWHFAPGKLATIPGGVQFSHSDCESIVLLVAGSAGYEQRIVPDSFSPAYGHKAPTPTLYFGTSARLPVEFATILVPGHQFNSQPGVLRMVEGNRSTGFVQAYLYSTTAEEICFVFSEEGTSWQTGPWASDARFLFCRVDANETLAQFVLYDGSYLKFRGRLVFASSTRVTHAEWYQGDLVPHFCCSDDSSVTLCPTYALDVAGPALATR